MTATKKRKHARTMEEAFRSLTIDGVTLRGGDLSAHFEQLKERRKKEEWKKDLSDTVIDLTRSGGGSLKVMTSGTTGAPKPVALPRRDVVNSARLTAGTFGLKEGDRVLLCLPCEYIAGKMMLVRAMALGLDLHIIDPRGSILDNLRIKDRFRFTAMVPLQLHRATLEDRARVERQFDTILLGGGPVSDALVEDLRSLSVHVFQSYGSTETVTHVALRKLNGIDRGDHYHAIGAVTFGTDQRGCLIIHTPHLTRKRHSTNDLVELIDATHFRWLGRADHVILSGGRKIFPEQLEAKTAGIVPYPHYFTSADDARLGQCVVLVLETDRPAQEVLPEVLDKVTAVLSPHELPRKVTAVRSILRTASGKIIRPR